MKKDCKACIEISHEDEIIKAQETLLQMRNIVVADDELLISRLLICDGCQHKTINEVCMKCGCYIKIRAFVKTNKCPNKNW